MRVLITGGAGFIGSVLVPALLREGHAVTVLDDFRHGPSLAAACASPGLTLVRADARDRGAVRELVPLNDAFIPLAALVGAPACDADPEAAEATNHRAVADLCDDLSPQQLVLYPNTNSGYGVGGTAPCTEEDELRPVSLYGRTKCAAERRVMGRENSVAFRLATVFGCSPRMRTDLMVNDFVLRAVTDGRVTLYEPQARRNFVHVRDAAAAFAHALANFRAMRGRVYNCGDTRANMTKAQLCDVIPLAWTEAPGSDPDRRDYLVLNDRLEAAGWRPSRTLAGGVAELKRYYVMSTERKGNA